MDKLKPIATKGLYGICPRCGKELSLIKVHYTAYGMYPSGFIKNRKGSKCKYVALCPCGFEMEMIDTIDGLLPKDLEKKPDDIIYDTKDEKPIGIVKEEI